MQIGLSREEIQVHIQSEKHRWNVDSQKIAISLSSAEPDFAETEIDEKPPKNDRKQVLKPNMGTNIHHNHIENGIEINNGTNSSANGSDECEHGEHAVPFGNSTSIELISNYEKCFYFQLMALTVD